MTLADQIDQADKALALENRRSKRLDVRVDPAVALARACIDYWTDNRAPVH